MANVVESEKEKEKQIPQSQITSIFSSIKKSIPSNFYDNLNVKDRNELSVFSEMTGIPIESGETFRQLAALLILNRFLFIFKYEEEDDFSGSSIEGASNFLKKKYPKMFISSVLDSIANLSSLVVLPSLLPFNQEFLNQSTQVLSSLYLEIVNQKFRRKMGQFWTPQYISEFMINLLLENNPRNILDPCTGPGTFIHTLREISSDFQGKITAIELHPLLYEITKVSLYDSPYKTELIYGDFLTTQKNDFNHSIFDTLALTSLGGLDSFFETQSNGFDAIICNPPYSRHHVISSKIKEEIGEEIENSFGGVFSRISSLFMYFILKSLKLLLENGRIVFITPTIIFESRNSIYLKKILKDRYTIPFIIVFHHTLSVFPGVDAAACIFTVEGKIPKPTDETKLLILKEWTSKERIRNYLKIVSNDVFEWSTGELYIKKQTELDPERNWTTPFAFSFSDEDGNYVEMSRYFRVMRGIATGNNKFFTFSDEELTAHKIDHRYVVPTISKTRYVQKYVLSKEDFTQLKDQQRNIWLLNIHQDIDTFQDRNLEEYLEYGVNQDVPEGSLVKTRKVWYQTEKRDIPGFLYTYLSRGNPRFILNEAKVRPLNTFLMIYPKEKIGLSEDVLTIFWVILNSQTTVRALRGVGRSYGGDTLKIEPKEMERALIVNPFKLSNEAKQELLKLAEELKTVETVQDKEIINKIDSILEKELKS